MHLVPTTLVGVLAQALLTAQQPGPPIDPGPLLCFTTIDESSGHRENVLRVASVRGTGPGREFWRGAGRRRSCSGSTTITCSSPTSRCRAASS